MSHEKTPIDDTLLMIRQRLVGEQLDETLWEAADSIIMYLEDLPDHYDRLAAIASAIDFLGCIHDQLWEVLAETQLDIEEAEARAWTAPEGGAFDKDDEEGDA